MKSWEAEEEEGELKKKHNKNVARKIRPATTTTTTKMEEKYLKIN
jgi:hypothetical protein